MPGDIYGAANIYIVTGYTDMRKSIDGLCAIVMDQLKEEPDTHSIYLFCGKRCDVLWGLYHCAYGRNILCGEVLCQHFYRGAGVGTERDRGENEGKGTGACGDEDRVRNGSKQCQ